MNHNDKRIEVEVVAANVGAFTFLSPIGIWVAGATSILNLCLVACLVVGLVILQKPVAKPTVVNLSAGSTGVEIQKALDSLPKTGGEVVLAAGIFEVAQPIVMQRDNQTLRGAGATTVLRLADGANCPVIILGEPLNHPRRMVSHLRVAELSIDGNRLHQQQECWRCSGEGSQIRNNGITLQTVSDSTVEHVTSSRCRSGGLVTTHVVRRLTVRDFTAYDNQFDGLACYQTEESLFTQLYLHDNPGAGISLDLAFNHNVISNAVLTANNLGIFMRASRNNQLLNVTVSDSRQYGVFMAQSETQTALGWGPAPRTECVDNLFNNLIATNCGGAAFHVNNASCTNNIISCAHFEDNCQGDLSLAAGLNHGSVNQFFVLRRVQLGMP
jgi:parallel beta-helix repeat protein